MGVALGASVGCAVGLEVGVAVGLTVGLAVGEPVGVARDALLHGAHALLKGGELAALVEKGGRQLLEATLVEVGAVPEGCDGVHLGGLRRRHDVAQQSTTNALTTTTTTTAAAAAAREQRRPRTTLLPTTTIVVIPAMIIVPVDIDADSHFWAAFCDRERRRRKRRRRRTPPPRDRRRRRRHHRGASHAEYSISPNKKVPGGLKSKSCATIDFFTHSFIKCVFSKKSCGFFVRKKTRKRGDKDRTGLIGGKQKKTKKKNERERQRERESSLLDPLPPPLYLPLHRPMFFF